MTNSEQETIILGVLPVVWVLGITFSALWLVSYGLPAYVGAAMLGLMMFIPIFFQGFFSYIASEIAR